jgi:hypothetical protein
MVRPPALARRRPIIDPGHGRRLLALRRTHMALRPIACYPADPYPSGGRTVPPEKGPSPEEVAHVDTHFPLFRIAFAAAAAVFIFLMVHAALEGVSRSADVLAGLQ